MGWMGITRSLAKRGLFSCVWRGGGFLVETDKVEFCSVVLGTNAPYVFDTLKEKTKKKSLFLIENAMKPVEKTAESSAEAYGWSAQK